MSDALAINTIRALAADMVQEANSGHPGEQQESVFFSFFPPTCVNSLTPDVPSNGMPQECHLAWPLSRTSFGRTL